MRGRLLVVAVIVPLLAGCSGQHACTAIGATSGVTFDLSALLAKVNGPLAAHFCVASVCTDQQVLPGTTPFVRVDDPSLTSTAAVLVQLKAIDNAGAVVFDSSAIVTPRLFQPNGPNCPPTAYGASVSATRAGRLQQTAP
jgi:hypothetical protein